MCTSVPSLIARNANPLQKLVNVVLTLELMPEAVCCCLQTCKCRFDIRVLLRTSVPSLIVRNANPTKL